MVLGDASNRFLNMLFYSSIILAIQLQLYQLWQKKSHFALKCTETFVKCEIIWIMTDVKFSLRPFGVPVQHIVHDISYMLSDK